MLEPWFHNNVRFGTSQNSLNFYATWSIKRSGSGSCRFNGKVRVRFPVTGDRLSKKEEPMNIAIDEFNSIPQLRMTVNALIMRIRCQTTADEVWKNLPWHKWSRQIWRIQRGIWKATTQNDIRRAQRLQTLLLRSRAGQALAVRQVTQLNLGKKTPGVDGKTARDTNERLKLCQRLRQHWHNWEHRRLKRVNIPNCEATAFGVSPKASLMDEQDR